MLDHIIGRHFHSLKVAEQNVFAAKYICRHTFAAANTQFAATILLLKLQKWEAILQ